MPLLKTENLSSISHDISEAISSDSSLDIPSLGNFITDLQKTTGEIPWHKNGKTDPWDLVESAMGLNISGHHKEAILAFKWMQQHQNPDGSWYSSYMNGKPLDKTLESNMSSYIATGLFHLWLITKNTEFLKSMWGSVKMGIDFALSLQTERGEIFWAKSPKGNVDPMALLTGSSSIFMSLKCAISIGLILGKNKAIEQWKKAFTKLQHSIQKQIHVYNISKSRYSMYWFYPVLSGALVGLDAEKRIEKQWAKYVVEGMGVKCVSDHPWVTIAETAELILSLEAVGKIDLAKKVFSWIQNCTYEDNTFWCGYTFPDKTIWPEHKISWTNAVVMMAADALYSLTPASNLFSHNSWNGFLYTRLTN